MSLMRLGLRVATLEALRPTSALPNGPFPTSAGALVFDSLEGPINDIDPAERKVTISVYTEEDNADPAQKAGGPPFKCTVTILFEIGVAQVGNDAQGAFVGTPATDAEAEAMLDLVSAQILFVLCRGPTGRYWRQNFTARRITDIDSLPHRSSEEGVRLARRAMRMRVTLDDDVFDPAPAVTPEGIARLPQKMQDLYNFLSASAYGKPILETIAALAPVMPTATPLNEVANTITPTEF